MLQGEISIIQLIIITTYAVFKWLGLEMTMNFKTSNYENNHFSLNNAAFSIQLQQNHCKFSHQNHQPSHR